MLLQLGPGWHRCPKAWAWSRTFRWSSWRPATSLPPCLHLWLASFVWCRSVSSGTKDHPGIINFFSSMPLLLAVNPSKRKCFRLGCFQRWEVMLEIGEVWDLPNIPYKGKEPLGCHSVPKLSLWSWRWVQLWTFWVVGVQAGKPQKMTSIGCVDVPSLPRHISLVMCIDCTFHTVKLAWD